MISQDLEILAGKGGGEMERFACNTQVISGTDAWSALEEVCCRKLLVVTTPEGIRAGWPDQVKRWAGTPETIVFEDFDAAPTMKRAVEGSRKIREYGPDLVVALGESGVLDLGKAMVCFAKHPCRLVAVPCAVDAGAAVAGFVTLSHNGQMHRLQDAQLKPNLVLLDPQMACCVPRNHIAEGGFALLAAALESYAASKEGSLSGIHAREGFAACWAALPAAFASRQEAHKRLQTASVLAGLAADTTGLGLCRAMGNSLGTVFGLSPGKAAAILLPVVVGSNAHASGQRYAALSRAAGLGGSREDIGSRNLKAGLERLRRELGLPGTLVQAGVDLRSVWNGSRKVVELTLADPECRNNPVTVDDFFVRRILEEITGRI